MSIDNLYIKKLFADLIFFKEDSVIKEELFERYKRDFNQEVLDFLNSNPDIKKEYDDILDVQQKEFDDYYDDSNSNDSNDTKEIEDFNSKEEEIDAVLAEMESEENKKKKEFKGDPDIRKIYRSIVKVTHPDKIKSEDPKEIERLKKYYLEATESYNSQNIYGIIRISSLLNLDIGEISDSNLDRLEKDLKMMKKSIINVENNMIWKYFNDIKLDFIKKITMKQFVLAYIEKNKRRF